MCHHETGWCHQHHEPHGEAHHCHAEHPWPPRPFGPGCCPPEGWGSPAAPWRMGMMPFLGRRFWSREERIAHLERYLEALRAEAKAVEERLAELKDQ